MTDQLQLFAEFHHGFHFLNHRMVTKNSAPEETEAPMEIEAVWFYFVGQGQRQLVISGISTPCS